MMQNLVVAVIVLVGVVVADSNTWHVSIDGSDTVGSGSSSHPWKTIGKAAAEYKEGDKIKIGYGRFDTPDNWATFPVGVQIEGVQGQTEIHGDPDLLGESCMNFEIGEGGDDDLPGPPRVGDGPTYEFFVTGVQFYDCDIGLNLTVTSSDSDEVVGIEFCDFYSSRTGLYINPQEKGLMGLDLVNSKFQSAAIRVASSSIHPIHSFSITSSTLESVFLKNVKDGMKMVTSIFNYGFFSAINHGDDTIKFDHCHFLNYSLSVTNTLATTSNHRTWSYYSNYKNSELTINGPIQFDNSNFEESACIFSNASGTMTDCMFSERVFSATVSLNDRSDVTIYGDHECNFTANADPKTRGGAIEVLTGSHLTLKDVVMHSNAAIGGGALYLSDASAVLTKVTFTRNIAHTGGAVFCDNSQLSISDSSFIDNRANFTGAVYCTNECTLTSSSNTRTNNVPADDGGCGSW